MKTPHPPFSDHTWRAGRFLPSLSPDFVKIDDRSEAELLAFAVEFAGLLTFFDAQEEPQHIERPHGTWEKFFDQDVSFLLARICLAEEHGEPSAPAGEDRAGEAWEQTRRTIINILDWYTRVANMRGAMEPGGVETALKATLYETIVEELARFELSAHTEFLGFVRDGHVDQILNRVHHRREQNPDAVDRAVRRITQKLAVAARDYLARSLHEKSDHPPHTALFLTFVTLLKDSQAHLNTLTEKHLDFYYQKVLRLRRREGAPDQAHVVFQLTPEARSFSLQTGTSLRAGTDEDGEDIIFETDEDLAITQTTVDSFKALYCRKDPAPANQRSDVDKEPAVRAIYAFPKADSQDGYGRPLEHPDKKGWRPFGRGGPIYARDADGRPDAEIGMVVASPVLLMREGVRRVEVIVKIASDRGRSLPKAVQAYRSHVEASWEGELSDADFHRVSSDAFLFAVSTADGFHRVTGYDVALGRSDPHEIAFSLSLAATDPPVQPITEAGDADRVASIWPMLKISLNPDARVFPYSALRELIVDSVTLGVEVTGLRKLNLQTSEGPLDAKKPFPLFGPLPTKGAYLMFANDELWRKRLDYIRLNLRWANLPQAPDDLESHYAAYGLGTHNDSFRAVFSVLSDFRWKTVAQTGNSQSAPDKSFPLFRPASPSGLGLSATASWQFDLDSVHLQGKLPVNDPLQYGLDTASGFFRLELTDPPYGFGHAVFPTVLTDVVSENTHLLNLRKKPVPKPPFGPVAAAAAVDYAATAHIRPASAGASVDASAAAGALYHLEPFGQIERATGDGATLVGDYDDNGYLFLGLRNARPLETLSLLFHIRESVAAEWCDEVVYGDGGPRPDFNHLTWRYLSNNTWRRFPLADVLEDTTHGLMRSGVVKLRLPRQMTDANSVMDSGLYWISVSTKRNPEHYGDVQGVYTQAATATRARRQDVFSAQRSAPAGTIVSLATPEPRIGSIRQPFASENGRDAESTDQFRVRVSERLKHKQRAIQPVDYERLVVEEFPSINEAKCIRVGAGDVMLVVTPMRDVGPAEREPCVSEDMLRRIAEFIRKHASSSVERIRVRNPSYEQVTATAWISLERDAHGSCLKDFEAALENYIAPWRFDDCAPMEIGTATIDLRDLRGALEKESYVRQLGGLSLVHSFRTWGSTASHVRHGLKDTARPSEGEAILHAATPWSVLVPAQTHSIGVSSDRRGISDLEISADFVLTSKDDAHVLGGDHLLFRREAHQAGVGSLEIGGNFIVTSTLDATPVDIDVRKNPTGFSSSPINPARPP